MASKIAKQEKKQNEMDPDFESYAKPDYWDTVRNSPLNMGTIMFAEKPTRNQKTKPNKEPKNQNLVVWSPQERTVHFVTTGWSLTPWHFSLSGKRGVYIIYSSAFTSRNQQLQLRSLFFALNSLK